MIARTRLNVTLYVHCLACYRFSDFGHPWDIPCMMMGDKRDAGAPYRLGAPRVPRFKKQKFVACGHKPAFQVLEVLPKIMQLYYLPRVTEVPSVNSLSYLAWLFTRKVRVPRAECGLPVRAVAWLCQANPRRLQLRVIPDCGYGLPVCDIFVQEC